MKYLITILILICSLVTQGQVKQLYNQYGGTWKRLEVKVGFRLPLNDSSTKDFNSAAFDTAQVYYNPADSSVYYYTGFQWLALSTGGGGTNIYNSDGTATGDRTFNLDGHYLDITGGSNIFLTATNMTNTTTGHWDVLNDAITRITIDASHSYLTSPDETNYLSINNSRVLFFLNNSTTDSLVIEDINTVALSDDDYVLLQRGSVGSKRVSKITIADLLAGAGGGTDNANIGSGFRWLKPSTQEIKTAFGGFAITIDSSSNTNGLTHTVDTTSGGVTSWVRTAKIIDSLQAAGWGNQSVNSDYRYYADMSNSTFANFYFGLSGANSNASVPTTAPLSSWFFGRKIETGTTNTGRVFGIPSLGTYNSIAIDNAYRYSCGIRTRFEDLSDGTETYGFFFGFGDDANLYTNIVDGVFFRYNHADSSGKFIACTRSNTTTTEDATDITVAADTWYDLQITGIGGSFYFYINGVLKATISTNIPTGTTRETSLVYSMNKSVGTTNRVSYVQWLGYDIRNN